MSPIRIAVVVALFPFLALAADCLENPGSARSWKLETPPDNASLSDYEGELRIDIRNAMQQSSAIQLLQEGKSLVAGRKYVLRFSAKASSPRRINIAGQMGDAPYYTFFYRPSVQIGTSYRTYEYTVLTKRGTEGQGRAPVFMIGSTAGTIWIKDASLQDVDPPSAAQTPISAPTPIAVPVQNTSQEQSAPVASAPASTDPAPADPPPSEPVAIAPSIDKTAAPPEKSQYVVEIPMPVPDQPQPAAPKELQGAVKLKLEMNNGGQADMLDDNGSERIDIRQIGAEAWSVQVYATHEGLRAGRYEVTFMAKADRPRSIEILPAQEHSDAYARLTGAAKAQVATSWQRYVVKFDMPESTKVVRSPVLIIGDTTGTFWIKQCTLAPVQ